MSKRLGFILLITAVLLLIPLIAMQFTNEVSWNGADFLVAGILLMGTGLAATKLFTLVKKVPQRIVVSLLAGAAFLLLWAELAVGIFGSPLAGS